MKEARNERSNIKDFFGIFGILYLKKTDNMQQGYLFTMTLDYRRKKNN